MATASVPVPRAVPVRVAPAARAPVASVVLVRVVPAVPVPAPAVPVVSVLVPAVLVAPVAVPVVPVPVAVAALAPAVVVVPRARRAVLVGVVTSTHCSRRWAARTSPRTPPVPEGTIVVERGVSAQEFAPKLNRSAADVIRFLMSNGEMVTATMTLSDEQMELFALEIGAELLLVEAGQQEELELQAMFDDSDDDIEELQEVRAPIVTIMGHVDHGKTTLLDKIRNANVVAGEAGGITQHIGAYQVEIPTGKITFLDTPGHAAFTKMRARGAQVTDIVVLMVAADDGVMPQTIEAINHAKAADVPIIVAINKIDKENADVQRTLSQLSEQELVAESWGGDTIMVEMSAQQNLGVDDLLEQLLVVAELEELTANPTGRAKGAVLEANLDTGRGPVATILIDKGTLKVGDPIVAGGAWGRVRAMIDSTGKQVKEAGPSTPVQVLGLSVGAQRGRRVPCRSRREDGAHRGRGPRAAPASHRPARRRPRASAA